MQIVRTAFSGTSVLVFLVVGFAQPKLLAQSVSPTAPPLPTPVQEQFAPGTQSMPSAGAIGPVNSGAMAGSPAASISPPMVSGPPPVAAAAPSSPQQSRLGLRHPRERGRLRARLRLLLHREN